MKLVEEIGIVAAFVGTLAFVAIVAACSPTDPAACVGFAPIRPTAAEVASLSPGTVAQIDAHNRYGAARCGWRP